MLFVRSFVRSYVRPYVRSFSRSFGRSFGRSSGRPSLRSFVPSAVYPSNLQRGSTSPCPFLYTAPRLRRTRKQRKRSSLARDETGSSPARQTFSSRLPQLPCAGAVVASPFSIRLRPLPVLARIIGTLPIHSASDDVAAGLGEQRIVCTSIPFPLFPLMGIGIDHVGEIF